MSSVKGRILVVDDQPDWRKTLSGLLLAEGYDVRLAATVHEALLVAGSDYLDVAVLDVRLDESNEDNREGLALMRQLKEIDPSIAIVILTGYADVEMVQEALQPNNVGIALASSFLQKFEADKLSEHVERALRLRAQIGHLVLARLIAQGENQYLEFKTSFRWDSGRGSVSKDLQEAVVVAVAGMLNSEGGTLLIGIKDDGTVVGIETDLETLHTPTRDHLQLSLTSILKKYLGIESVVMYVRIDFECVRDKWVCAVSVKKSAKPVFCSHGDGNKFWVRTGNSTHSLDPKETMAYVQAHWQLT